VGTEQELRAALEHIVTMLNNPDYSFVETIEEVHALARRALSETPPADEGAGRLDAGRVARALVEVIENHYAPTGWEPGEIEEDVRLYAVPTFLAAYSESAPEREQYPDAYGDEYPFVAGVPVPEPPHSLEER